MPSRRCAGPVPGLGLVLARAVRTLADGLLIELGQGRACNQAEPAVWWPGAGSWPGTGQRGDAGRPLGWPLSLARGSETSAQRLHALARMPANVVLSHVPLLVAKQALRVGKIPCVCRRFCPDVSKLKAHPGNLARL